MNPEDFVTVEFGTGNHVLTLWTPDGDAVPIDPPFEHAADAGKACAAIRQTFALWMHLPSA